jgi:hypothetical protein
MISITAATEKTFQSAVVNSIRQNLDTQATICLYTNKNSKRSPMIAMNTPDIHIENSYMRKFEQKNTMWYNLVCNIDQESSNFRSVLP